MRRFSLCLFFAVFATALTAQDRPNTILVMDGSGSMWGQIDGVAKITIAQEVVSDLMDSWPEGENIGLTVYGHRERGNCADIETIVAPGPDTRDAIRAAVNGIKPLGKTPMTDSIIAAAEALRYTEDSATVILVSDGVETCNPDPCAAMRLLEEAGIDFTAHVVGFDVGSDAIALQQMQCIADETGGRFLMADNAEELVAALQDVAAEPEPVALTMTFTAVIGDDKRLIESPVLWGIKAGDKAVGDEEQSNPMSRDLDEGAYVATAYSLELEQTVAVNFVVIEGGPVAVEAVFEEPAATAMLVAPDTALVGETVLVGWDGPGGEQDYLTVADPATPDYINYSNVRDGNPVELLMPPQPGVYELRYIQRDGTETIATRAIEVLPVEVTLSAVEDAPKGSDVAVTWTGPDYQGDYIAVALAGGSYINYANTRDGNPSTVQMPTEPGEYELQYVMRQGSTVMATFPITVTELEVSVTAPETAPAGSTVMVDWNGPDYQGDYIAVGEVGGGYINYTNTRDGNPSALEMPPVAGEYEIRYVLRQDSEVLATTPITVTGLKAEITIPTTAIAGETIDVSWVGPDYQGDYIAVAEVGSNQYINYTNTRDGATLGLQMPVIAGDYEVLYVMRQGTTIILREPITITPLKVRLVASETATTGSEIIVGWDGPDYQGDYISIATPDSTGYETYANTRDGNPVTLRVPDTAGDYEIRYILRQGSTVAARIPLRVD